MPLEGFRILDWASRTFGGMPATVVGGLGVAVLIAGAITAVSGLKQQPTSWALLGAGLGMIVLTYFIVGAAISGVSTTLEGGRQVTGAAPRIVPAAAAIVAAGMGLFGLRKSLEYWSSEESSGKVGGLLVAVLSLGLVFVGVQIVRGANGAAGAPATTPEATEPAPGNDEPVRHRSITGTPRR